MRQVLLSFRTTQSLGGGRVSQSHNLQFLESTNNLSSVIERKHGWHPNLAQTQEILACLRQGRLFYEASASSPIEIRPLQQFYGMLGFAKALILVTDRKKSVRKPCGITRFKGHFGTR
ncbi:YaaC family protein [Trinickia sp.]|uniref:YaaC family protein n=1 Tax=Trinickia sp. TaxID=2571163 RepID=UPI0039C9E484